MYLRIVEYGEHPHTKGLQRLTLPVARRLEGHFHSLRGLLARRFGGLPVYIGHPDDPDYRGTPGHTDTRAHGWVTDLQARPDGLYGRFKWADTGRELISNAHYKFLSPRWMMRPAGDGAFEPTRLLSIGLTNNPNIPGEPIANEAPAPVENPTPPARPVPGLPSEVRTAALGARRGPNRSAAIVDAVNARMADTGEDFATAWTALKRTRQDLF